MIESFVIHRTSGREVGERSLGEIAAVISIAPLSVKVFCLFVYCQGFKNTDTGMTLVK